ncbi:MAG: glycosyltransferase [Burkholderiales bacterium]|nr:glycosyltransferase [Burkholderiales bacterium]
MGADKAGTMMRNEQLPDESVRVEIQLTQSLTISSMWKEIKSLNLQLSMINQARQDLSSRLEQAEQDLSSQLEQERNASVQASQQFRKHIDDLSSRAVVQQQALLESMAQIESLNTRFNEVLTSKSWRLTRPVRAFGHLLRKFKILARALLQLLREPTSLPENSAKLLHAWRSGGSPSLKSALVGVQQSVNQTDAWQAYRLTFNEYLKPRIIQRIDEMTTTPSISIIVPTYNTPDTMLREMLESVTAQLYPHWELCIADDGSDQPQVKKTLTEYAGKDPRIKLHFEPGNHGVSYASNRALEMATSEFVVLLDHDDLLEEHALFRFAEAILQDKPDMVYSDEVLVTPDASIVTKYVYRPAFSPEFLRSHPYIVHLVGFRTQLLRDIGGFDEKLKISQDYDLILRATESALTIAHIPEILYQWRVHPSSAGHLQINEVMEVSRDVLQRHLERCGEKGIVHDGVGFNFFDARYPLDTDSRVAIIIPTKNHGDLLQQCIHSIRTTVLGVKYDVVVVDHESDDPATLTYLSSISDDVRILRYKGVFNFSAINNWAISHLGSEYSHYLFCNNDIEAIKPGWLERMLELGQHQTVAIVGAKLLYPDRETVQHAGVCVGLYGAAEHYGKFVRVPTGQLNPGYYGGLVINHEVAAVTAACLLMRRNVFEEISGFDEAIAVGFGDTDLCLRAGQKGYRVLFCPFAQLVHHESYTRGTSSVDTHPIDTALFKARWQDVLKTGDPYYNPGLSPTSTCWQNTNPMHCSVDIKRRVFKRDPLTGMQEITI